MVTGVIYIASCNARVKNSGAVDSRELLLVSSGLNVIPRPNLGH